MKLHYNVELFNDLCGITAVNVGIPSSAIKRDYFIVMLLQNLNQSEYKSQCVFKGGTSLSKAYPGSINRFSEDIDLTYVAREELSSRQYDKKLKDIEKIMTKGMMVEKINEERNDRNKSSFVWDKNYGRDETRIKLEIGSQVRPDPYEEKPIKTYIQEYLESINQYEIIHEYELEDVYINVLNIERTFIDKIMSVKRHAICGTLEMKVRHIYDVVMLFQRNDIQEFLLNKNELKRLIKMTKETDSYYLQKRNTLNQYNPMEKYSFNLWENCFDLKIQNRYENLHIDLLYTNEKQDFNLAKTIFLKISHILDEIEE